MIRTAMVFLGVLQITAFGQSIGPTASPASSNCPVEIVKMNPSHESFWNNMATAKTYGHTTYSDHNKFLEVKVKNNTDKTIAGIKFVTGYYDATEDLITIPVEWGMHHEIKPGEVGTGNWDTNRYQKKTSIGWVVLPLKILFTDGSKWHQTGSDCMYQWWKDKNHPRVNQAPNLDGVKLEGE